MLRVNLLLRSDELMFSLRVSSHDFNASLTLTGRKTRKLNGLAYHMVIHSCKYKGNRTKYDRNVYEGTRRIRDTHKNKL